MTIFKGLTTLNSMKDWKALVGEGKWDKGKSAYELAFSWTQAKGIPSNIYKCISCSGNEKLKGIKVKECIVEKPIYLDTKKAPSMNDIMVYAENHASESIIIAVEGKAEESFDKEIKDWICGDYEQPQPTRINRLKFLNQYLCTSIKDDSSIKYQLLHRTVSGVLEGLKHGSAAVLILVHSFGNHNDTNWNDFKSFLGEMGTLTCEKHKVLGPVNLGLEQNMQTFFLWWDSPIS